MKHYKNIFFSFITLTFVLLSSCADYVDTIVPSPTVPTGNPAVRFSPYNKTSYEFDPSGNTSFVVAVKRSGTAGAAEYPIEVVSNDNNSYIVPSSVSFAAGQDSTTITVQVNPTAETDVNLPLQIKIADDFSNPYMKQYSTYFATSTLVKWDNLGTCQFSDAWTLYSVANVELFYAPSKKDYRFTNPYSRELLEEAEWEDWIGGPTQEFIYFKVAENKRITWNFWYLGLNYQGNEGQPIKAYLPSIRNSANAQFDALSKVSDENDLLYVFTPEFYIDGVGGYGRKVCYLSLPGGPDLN